MTGLRSIGSKRVIPAPAAKPMAYSSPLEPATAKAPITTEKKQVKICPGVNSPFANSVPP
jgi:hypothetical protein